VVNLVALIVAPIIVTYKSLGIGGWLVVLVLLAVLVWAIMQSKKPAPKLSEIDVAAPAPGD